MMPTFQEFLGAPRAWLDAFRWKSHLGSHYRARYGWTLDPLQFDRSVVPPRDVVGRIQKKNKAEPATFFASGFRHAYTFLVEAERRGFDASRARRILDFGMGTGRVLLHYLPFRAELHGCDVTAEAADWTRRTLGSRADIRLTSSEPPLPYPDNYFDFVYATSVFTHVPFARQSAWIAEMRRIAAPGARLVVTVHETGPFAEKCRPSGWFETKPDRGVLMNVYIEKEKLLDLWSPHFDVLDFITHSPEQSHLILGTDRSS